MDDHWTTANGALKAIVDQNIFMTTSALRPGKLNDADAEELRQHRDGIDAARDRLVEVLAKIAQHLPGEAAEVEGLAARLLHHAGCMWHLNPLPTPNARKRVVGENPARLREIKASSPKAKTIKAVCDAEFEVQLKKRPADWDGKKDRWTVSGRALGKINSRLEKQGIRGLSHDTIDRRFKTYLKEVGR